MSTRRVRTAAGAARYGKPIGSVIARGVSVGRGENIVSRRAPVSRDALANRRSDIKAVRQTYRGQAPALPAQQERRVRDAIEYQSPKMIAAARRATGRNQRPEREALAAVRGRRALTGRAVAANPLSGRITAKSVQARVPVKRASASRAVAARRTPPKPAYVGRRRAKD